MKNAILFLLLVSCSFSHAQKPITDTLFATIENNEYIFKLDTLTFKEKIAKNIFSKKSKVDYDKLTIVEQVSLGKEKASYIFLLLLDFDKKIKTARLLKKINNNLFLSQEKKIDLTYVSCVGDSLICLPNIIINNHLEMEWICSDKKGVCIIDNTKCRKFNSIIVD